MKTTSGRVCVAATSAVFALGSVGRVFAQPAAPSEAASPSESASATSAAPVAPAATPEPSAVTPAGGTPAAAQSTELVIPPDCEPGFGMKDGRCAKCDPPCPAGATCAGGLVCIPGVPRVTCPKGSVLVHDVCVPSERVFSRKKEVCDPPCAAGNVCKGTNYCRPPDRNPYLHDGVYFRFGAGIGGGAVSKKVDGFEKETSGGLAPAFEVALGGAPTPGFVFGVGIYGARIIDPSGVSSTFGDVTLVGTGPFVDVYPLPKNGFHVQAALTYSTLWMSPMTTIEVEPGPSVYCSSTPCTVTKKVDYGGSGLGLMWGIGFEGWTSPQFAAGVLFRFQYFSTTVMADDAPYPNATASVVVPALLVTLTAQ
jgi:hypothetical protein